MALIVIAIVALVTLFMLGYRFDTHNGEIQQYAFIYYDSIPSGATVAVDGNVISSKTPNKSSLPAGKHEVQMWRDGYQVWKKKADLKAGTNTWFNYTLLVPKDLPVEVVSNYDSIYRTLASSNGNEILVQKSASMPSFELVDLSADTIKSTSISIPNNLYSQANVAGTIHEFTIEKWDHGGRYVLVKHNFNGSSEWLVLDTQNVSTTKNITKLFDIPISSIVFADTSGNKFYVLNLADIRKLDLSAGTISKTLVSNVISFDIYNESKVITYVGSGNANKNERVVGIYREGDDKSSIVRTISGSQDLPLHINTTVYFNENYIAISLGNKIDVLSGSYPNTTTDNNNAMKIVASFEAMENINLLSFSPSGEYVFVQSGQYFASYDLEYKKTASSNIEGSGDTLPLKWLDDNYIWSDRGGRLSIREFDGDNIHTINNVIYGQDATLTNNGRYFYSIGKSQTGYQLQRVRMILP